MNKSDNFIKVKIQSIMGIEESKMPSMPNMSNMSNMYDNEYYDKEEDIFIDNSIKLKQKRDEMMQYGENISDDIIAKITEILKYIADHKCLFLIRRVYKTINIVINTGEPIARKPFVEKNNIIISFDYKDYYLNEVIARFYVDILEEFTAFDAVYKPNYLTCGKKRIGGFILKLEMNSTFEYEKTDHKLQQILVQQQKEVNDEIYKETYFNNILSHVNNNLLKNFAYFVNYSFETEYEASYVLHRLNLDPNLESYKQILKIKLIEIDYTNSPLCESSCNSTMYGIEFSYI